MFRPGSFARSIAERGTKVKMLANHDDRSFPVGRATRLWEEPDGLYLEGRVSNTADGNDALTLVRDGVVTGLSVGFKPVVAPMVDGVREIREAALIEVSLTAWPCYEGADILAVRSSLSPYLDALAALDPARGIPTSLASRELDLLELRS